jgi:hypothetical protein
MYGKARRKVHRAQGKNAGERRCHVGDGLTSYAAGVRRLRQCIARSCFSVVRHGVAVAALRTGRRGRDALEDTMREVLARCRLQLVTAR